VLSMGADDQPDCFLALDPRVNICWLVFRGTKTEFDILTDLAYYPKALPDSLTSLPTGSLLRVQSLLPGLLETLRHNQGLITGWRLRLTGHSLGGGLAMCMLALLLQEPEATRALLQDIFGGDMSAITFSAPLSIAIPAPPSSLDNSPGPLQGGPATSEGLPSPVSPAQRILQDRALREEDLAGAITAASANAKAGVDMIDTLSLKELEALIAEAGLSVEGCIEKSDIQARAREAQAVLLHASALQREAPLASQLASHEALVAELSRRSKHVVHQFDFVPRLLGDHEVPVLSVLTGGCAPQLATGRRRYRPVGSFILLYSDLAGVPCTRRLSAAEASRLLSKWATVNFVMQMREDHRIRPLKEKIFATAML